MQNKRAAPVRRPTKENMQKQHSGESDNAFYRRCEREDTERSENTHRCMTEDCENLTEPYHAYCRSCEDEAAENQEQDHAERVWYHLSVAQRVDVLQRVGVGEHSVFAARRAELPTPTHYLLISKLQNYSDPG